MAATASLVKLLRQLSQARDEYRSGAVDIDWKGGHATLYLVFGKPTHLTVALADGRELEGQDALSVLVTSLPSHFDLAPFRKEIVRTESLQSTMDDLLEPFAQLVGRSAESDAAPGDAFSEDGDDEMGLDFGLDDFPLLPLGPALWSEAAASVVHLEALTPKLP